jgi:hypothetical protein
MIKNRAQEKNKYKVSINHKLYHSVNAFDNATLLYEPAFARYCWIHRCHCRYYDYCRAPVAAQLLPLAGGGTRRVAVVIVVVAAAVDVVDVVASPAELVVIEKCEK